MPLYQVDPHVLDERQDRERIEVFVLPVSKVVHTAHERDRCLCCSAAAESEMQRMYRDAIDARMLLSKDEPLKKHYRAWVQARHFWNGRIMRMTALRQALNDHRRLCVLHMLRSSSGSVLVELCLLRTGVVDEKPLLTFQLNYKSAHNLRDVLDGLYGEDFSGRLHETIAKLVICPKEDEALAVESILQEAQNSYARKTSTFGHPSAV